MRYEIPAYAGIKSGKPLRTGKGGNGGRFDRFNFAPASREEDAEG
jgi:hypothetical protein